MKYILLFMCALVCCRASDEYQRLLSDARRADRAVLEWSDESTAQHYGLNRICADRERPDDLHSLLVNLVEDEYKYERSWKDKDGTPVVLAPYCPDEEHYTHKLTFFLKDKETTSFRVALDGRSDAVLLKSNTKVQLTRGSILFLATIGRYEKDLAVIMKREEEAKKAPNKALVPTVMSVTPAADAPVAPATTAAHL